MPKPVSSVQRSSHSTNRVYYLVVHLVGHLSAVKESQAMPSRRGRGEDTIRHNVARHRWEGRLTVALDANGRPVRRMVTGRTRAEVVNGLRQLRDATDAGRQPAERHLT